MASLVDWVAVSPMPSWTAEAAGEAARLQLTSWVSAAVEAGPHPLLVLLAVLEAHLLKAMLAFHLQRVEQVLNSQTKEEPSH